MPRPATSGRDFDGGEPGSGRLIVPGPGEGRARGRGQPPQDGSPYGQPPQDRSYGQPPQDSSPYGQPPQDRSYGQPPQESYGQPPRDRSPFGRLPEDAPPYGRPLQDERPYRRPPQDDRPSRGGPSRGRPSHGGPPRGRPPRGGRRRLWRRLWNRRWVRIVLAMVLTFVLIVAWSVGHALTAPGGGSTSERLAEWARDHYLGPVVTLGEWITYQPPKAGGKPSFALTGPTASVAKPVKHHGRKAAAAPVYTAPPNLQPLVAAPTARRGELAGARQRQWRARHFRHRPARQQRLHVLCGGGRVDEPEAGAVRAAAGHGGPGPG